MPIKSDPNALAPNGRPIGGLLYTFKPTNDGQMLATFPRGFGLTDIEAVGFAYGNRLKFLVVNEEYPIAIHLYGGRWLIEDESFYLEEPTQIVPVEDPSVSRRLLRSGEYDKFRSFLLVPIYENGRDILRIYRVRQ